MRWWKLAIKSEKNRKYYRKCSNNFAADCTVCSIINFQLGDHGFAYLWLYITDKNVFNGVFNDEPGCRNRVTSCFHTSLDSVWSIMMAASMLCGIVKNIQWQLAFVVVILSDGMSCNQTHVSVTSCFHWSHFK